MPLPFTGAELRQVALDFLLATDAASMFEVVTVKFTVNGRTKTGRPIILTRNADMALQLTIDEEVEYTADFQSSAGRSTAVDGVPRWTVIPADAGTVMAAADGRSAVFSAGPNPMTCTLECRADAARGEAVREIFAVDSIVITEGEAMVVQLSAGAPRPKPAQPGPTA